jgi:hypothetical protein
MTEGSTGSAPGIVVGLDESPSARSALLWAARQARLTDTSIQAIHVLDWPIGIAAFTTEPPDGDGFLHDTQIQQRYRAGIRRLFDEVDPAPDWSLRFAVGDAGRILVRAAAGAELLVIGARTPDDPAADWHVRAGLFFGQATCPVVLVPERMFMNPQRGPDPGRSQGAEIDSV